MEIKVCQTSNIKPFQVKDHFKISKSIAGKSDQSIVEETEQTVKNIEAIVHETWNLR